MWCEGQCLSTLPFIHGTQQGRWTRRSVATSLTSVPGSPAELLRSSAIFSCRALVPECLCLCPTHSTFSGPQTLSCAGRSTCWFFPKLLTWCRGGGFSLPSPQHPLHLSPGLLCKTWSPSWEVEKGHYTNHCIYWGNSICSLYTESSFMKVTYSALFRFVFEKNVQMPHWHRAKHPAAVLLIPVKAHTAFSLHTSALLGWHPRRLHACSSGRMTGVTAHLTHSGWGLQQCHLHKPRDVNRHCGMCFLCAAFY